MVSGHELHINSNSLKVVPSKYLKRFISWPLLIWISVSLREGASNHMLIIVNYSLVDHIFRSLSGTGHRGLNGHLMPFFVSHLLLGKRRQLDKLCVVSVMEFQFTEWNELLLGNAPLSDPKILKLDIDHIRVLSVLSCFDLTFGSGSNLGSPNELLEDFFFLSCSQFSIFVGKLSMEL